MKKTILVIVASFLLIGQANATNEVNAMPAVERCHPTMVPIDVNDLTFISTATIQKNLDAQLEIIHLELVKSLKETTSQNIKMGISALRHNKKSSIATALFTMLRE